MTWIEHPTMPGRLVEVSELSVPHHRAAGWQVVEAPVKPKKASKGGETPSSDDSSAKPEEASGEADEPKTEPDPPKSRRRTPSKED